jgi:hypothetical protein
MAKKPSKAKSKRSKARARPRDRVTGQQFLFDPVTGEPARPPRGRQRKQTPAEIEAMERRRLELKKRSDALRAAFREQRRRHDDGVHRFSLPKEVRLFLERLYDEPWLYDEPQITRARVEELLREVYVQGCTQGFIEGRVQGMERDRLVSQKRNQRKRQKNSLDDRDAAIAAEYVQLCSIMPVGAARERLAAKYECDPRTIYNVARKAGLIRPRSNSGRRA